MKKFIRTAADLLTGFIAAVPEQFWSLHKNWIVSFLIYYAIAFACLIPCYSIAHNLTGKIAEAKGFDKDDSNLMSLIHWAIRTAFFALFYTAFVGTILLIRRFA